MGVVRDFKNRCTVLPANLCCWNKLHISTHVEGTCAQTKGGLKCAGTMERKVHSSCVIFGSDKPSLTYC